MATQLTTKERKVLNTLIDQGPLTLQEMLNYQLDAGTIQYLKDGGLVAAAGGTYVVTRAGRRKV